MTSQRLTPTYLLLGEILRPHGIKGELRVKILTDFPERVSEIKTVYIGSDPAQPDATPHTIESVRFHKNYLLLTLENVRNRTDVEPFRGQFVMIDLEHAIPLEADEFYFYELIGLRVRTVDGEELGTLQEVMETGANDVYVVSSRTYGKVLIPAHSETVVNIDFDTETITVQLPDGLLPRG